MKKILCFMFCILFTGILLYAQAPTDPEVAGKRKAAKYVRAGLDFEDSAKVDLAIAEFSKAIAFKPDYGEAYFHRARLYFDKEEYKKAREDFDKAILFDPLNSEALLGRANLNMFEKQMQAAYEDYEQVITLDPENLKARYNFVIASYFVRKIKSAMDDIDYVIENDEDGEYFDIWKYKGRFHYSFDEGKESLDALDTYLKKFPDDPVALEYRSETYQLLGEYEKAFEDSEKARKLREETAGK